MSENQQYPQVLARHVKAALMHPRQAEDLAELAWEEPARACVYPPGQCLRGDFADYAGGSGGCMVCAELDPDQPCYAAVLKRVAVGDPGAGQ
jgi:hypothetical protein